MVGGTAGPQALPAGVRWAHILGAGIIAGIGFTVSIFIADLAFDDPVLVADAKIGILAASVVMGIAGLAYLSNITRDRGSSAEEAP